MSELAPITPTVVVTGGKAPDDTVSLLVNGQSIVGWTDVRVTRRAEGCTNDFEVGLTASNPNGTPVVAFAGQACEVKIGGRTVITGWIDVDGCEGDANSHRLVITGRGKCCDLVDSSAEWPGGQISGANALVIASKLAVPYGITVVQYPGLEPPKPIPQFNLNYGETAQSIIDRVCTYAGLLYYENEAGELVIAQVGTAKAASGFAYGGNVEEFGVHHSMAERFSDYTCALLSLNVFQTLGDGAENLYFTAYDPNMKRHRQLYLVIEAQVGGQDLCELTALWEAGRRAGRGISVTVTADSWRDAGGTLWTPNTLAPVTLPGLRLPPASELVISEVTYHFNMKGGHTADVTLLPYAAFALQPVVIQPTPIVGLNPDPA